jgi:hypothetical protein
MSLQLNAGQSEWTNQASVLQYDGYLDVKNNLVPHELGSLWSVDLPDKQAHWLHTWIYGTALIRQQGADEPDNVTLQAVGSLFADYQQVIFSKPRRGRCDPNPDLHTDQSQRNNCPKWNCFY